MTISRRDIEKIILNLLDERGADKTICPSEAARHISDQEQIWRPLMKDIRNIAIDMARDKKIVITKKGVEQDPFTEIKGFIRLKKT